MSGSFLGLPVWYKYLNVVKDANGNCTVNNFVIPGDIVLVALAVVEILLRIGGMVGVAYVIWGGIKYVTSQGEPDKAQSARQTIIYATIGVVISISATVVVNFIGTKLG